MIEELLHDVDDASVGCDVNGDNSAVNPLVEKVVGTRLNQQQVNDRLRRVEHGVVKQIRADKLLEARVHLRAEDSKDYNLECWKLADSD